MHLLQHLDRLLDDLRNFAEGLLALLRDDLAGRGQQLVQRLLLLDRCILLNLANVDLCGIRGFFVDLSGVPQHHVLFDVVQHGRNEGRSNGLVATEHRVRHEVQVDLQVSQVILLRERDDWTAHRGRNVLVDGIQLQWLGGWQQQVLALWHLQALKEHDLDLAQVIQLRHLLGSLHDGLHLGKPLGFAEDVGVADRHDVHRAFEVATLDQQLAGLVVHLFFGQVGLVQAEQQLQHTAHGVVQACVDR